MLGKGYSIVVISTWLDFRLVKILPAPAPAYLQYPDILFSKIQFEIVFSLSLSQLLHHFYLKRVKIPILDFSFFNVNSVSVAEPKPLHFGWSRSRCEGQAPAAP